MTSYYTVYCNNNVGVHVNIKHCQLLWHSLLKVMCLNFLLQEMIGVCSKKEYGQLDTMLPLNPSTDVWREAQPVTKITDSVYPFGDDGKRPTSDEVRNTHCLKYLRPLGSVDALQLDYLN